MDRSPRLPLQKGMFVGQNAPVFLLVSAEREVSFNIPPAETASFYIGKPLTFIYGGEKYPIVVKQTPSAPINGVVPLSASLPRTFTPPFGIVGSVTCPITLARGAIIPFAALQSIEDRNYVFTVSGNKTLIREIVILGETGISAAVSGIEDNTVVIVNPPPGLIDGSPVQPIMIRSDQGIPAQAAPVPGNDSTGKGKPGPGRSSAGVLSGQRGRR